MNTKFFALLFAVSGLVAAAPAHASVIATQRDASDQISFVNNSSSFIGYPTDVFVLPAITGTLKSFDIYLSMSSYNLASNNAQGTPQYVTIALGGAGCPTSSGTDQNGGTYLVSDLGTPVTTSSSLPAPTLAHFVLSGAGNIPTYSGQTGCTIQISQNGSNDNKLMATMGSTTLANPLYFVGYDTDQSAPQYPTDKDQCKDGGWRTFTAPSFKNQGACVSFVVSHRHDNDSEDE